MFSGCIKKASSAGHTLKVMSYNVWQFNRNISKAAAIIKKEKPDILLLQEVAPDKIEFLKCFLRNLYDGDDVHVAYEPGILQSVISRYPVKSFSASPEKNRLQKVILDTPFGLTTVINIHAYKHGWQNRHAEMEKIIKDDIIPEKGPLIFGGDFNTNDQSETYNLRNGYLRDAHREAGCGFGFTFPSTTSFFSMRKFTPPKYSMFPVIRIDYIFHSEQFIAFDSYVVKNSGGADHYPIVVTLTLQSHKKIVK
jgi:endonuclease/exonuclease/phosphatase (EEP) superfamily protein YafD